MAMPGWDKTRHNWYMYQFAYQKKKYKAQERDERESNANL